MMNTMNHQLTVAIAVPLEAELVELIRGVDPDVTVLYDADLLPPERFPADHSGDPDFVRSPHQEERYWSMLNAADVLFGLPGESAQGLARVADENPRLRWVHAMAAGAGAAVRAAGLDRGQLERIMVTTSAGVHARPLAEFALMGVLNGLKRVPELQSDQAARRWPELRVPVRTAQGSRLVIAGLGEIGVEAAGVARALGMKVSGTRRTAGPMEGVEHVVTNDELATLVRSADAVVNTLPGTEETENLFNAELFAAFRPGTVLVNVGRGTVIDEHALLGALEDGKVSYACLDVFAVEPLPPESPLWGHPRVLVSPHTSALSTAENRLIAERFASNLRTVLDGGVPPHVVDTVHFY
ncbi:D-2-hydroxyacid dehydrogenase [Micrococcaceae bacterium RIT802]|nr:D-2-hydroxyacid dehydrogenase [Micrococcaceae bacterium RIT 802]